MSTFTPGLAYPLKITGIGGGDMGLSYKDSDHPFCLVPLIHPEHTEKGQRVLASTIAYRMQHHERMLALLERAWAILKDQATHTTGTTSSGEHMVFPLNEQAMLSMEIEKVLKALHNEKDKLKSV